MNKSAVPPLGRAALRRWRTGEGMSQMAAASAIGIDAWYYSKIERGDRRPGLDVALQIERASRGSVPVSLWGRAA